MPLPPRVVGGDYEGGFTLAARSLGRAFALYIGNCYWTFAHLCKHKNALVPSNRVHTARAYEASNIERKIFLHIFIETLSC